MNTCESGKPSDIVQMLVDALYDNEPSKIARWFPCVDAVESINILMPAAVYGYHTDIVEKLISLGAPNAEYERALWLAVEMGHFDIVKILVGVCDPKSDNSYALQLAAREGFLDIVRLLIPLTDPLANDSLALKWATNKEHIDIVKLLLPVSNPKANKSRALRSAVQNQNKELVQILLPLSDYASVLKRSDIQDSPRCCILLQQCIDEYEASQQKIRLTDALSACQETVLKGGCKRKI